jgi:hypothetical protein
LTPLAVMFLVAHEFRHITGGHLGWLNAQSGQEGISEVLGIQRDPSTGLFLQALELDADGFAMYYILMRAFAMAEGSQESLPTSLRGPVRSTDYRPLQSRLASTCSPARKYGAPSPGSGPS